MLDATFNSGAGKRGHRDRVAGVMITEEGRQALLKPARRGHTASAQCASGPRARQAADGLTGGLVFEAAPETPIPLTMGDCQFNENW